MGRRNVPITANGPVGQLAQALRDLRESAGLTLRELARLIGYSHSTLSAAERGRTPPSWAVTDAFTTGCGESSAEWRPLWAAAVAAHNPDEVLAVAATASGLARLPSRPPGFVGRAAELKELFTLAGAVGEDANGPPLIGVISGLAGVGKTALALQFAHLAAEQFADGQLFVNAQAHWPGDGPLSPREVLVRLMRALGQGFVAAGLSIEELAGIFRRLTAGLKMLIVLDDVANPEQIRAAIPGDGHFLVLVTSRRSLSGLVVRDGAQRVPVRGLPLDEALALLARAAPAGAVEADPESARRLTGSCGDLPLALRIAAYQLAAQRYRSLAELADAVACDRQCLDVLAVDGDETASIRSVLSWSFRGLPPEVARALSSIGSVEACREAAFSLADVADVVGRDPVRAGALLRSLTEVSLLDELGADRYALHRLVRLYACERPRSTAVS
jgi:DNA-binding XRE family transcriptional regulator